MTVIRDRISKIERVSSPSLRYDLEVADNHNFIANQVLVHNCQNLPNLEEILATKDLVATTKVDGTSCTMYLMNGEFGVCSRNQELKDTEENTLWKMARKYDIEARLRAKGLNVALQGEVAGPGIQSNRAKLISIGFYVFTIQNLDTNTRLTPVEQGDFIAEMNLGPGKGDMVQSVPFLGIYPAGTFKTLADLEDFSNGPTGLANVAKADQQVAREGVVFRSTDGAVSFKFISPSYLIRHSL
jgi:RNA ligase (TIGR02306 family)